MPTPEELARRQIDALLQKCGWNHPDYRKLDLSAGKGIAIREVRTSTGTCEYLILIDRKPVGVIEAKKQGKTLSGVADQSGRYATGLPDLLRGNLTGSPPASRPTSATNATRIRAHADSLPSTVPKPSHLGSKTLTPSAIA